MTLCSTFPLYFIPKLNEKLNKKVEIEKLFPFFIIHRVLRYILFCIFKIISNKRVELWLQWNCYLYTQRKTKK